jgi:hypothetical protein
VERVGDEMGSWKDKNLMVNDKLNPDFFGHLDSLTSSILKDYREDTLFVNVYMKY